MDILNNLKNCKFLELFLSRKQLILNLFYLPNVYYPKANVLFPQDILLLLTQRPFAPHMHFKLIFFDEPQFLYCNLENGQGYQKFRSISVQCRICLVVLAHKEPLYLIKLEIHSIIKSFFFPHMNFVGRFKLNIHSGFPIGSI